MREILDKGTHSIGPDEVQGVIMLLRGHIMELTHALHMDFPSGKEPVHERIDIARELSGKETPSDLSESRAHIDALTDATRHLLELLKPADTHIVEESGHEALTAGGTR
ncbi:hypothetical protein ACFU8W_43100 [Streptomyces sp. NPDC057565]|uniref:hypothetical protein n=1 Tax=Streptomyces sp. NPDC057565 TaxID=3346169 RepID=UPI00368DFD23